MKGEIDTSEAAEPASGSLEYLIEKVLDLATMPAALIYLYACKVDDEENEKRPHPIRDEAATDRPMWGVDDYADAG